MSDIDQRVAELSPAKRELLRQLAARQRGGAQRIQPRPRPERVPLTFGQRRLWWLQRLQPDNIAYNLPVGLWLDGDVDRAALRAALQALIDRHEPLRTVFLAEDGEPYQHIRAHAELPWRETDAGGDADALRQARDEMARPFALDRDAMLRATLIAVGERRHLLLLSFHHIAIDGWSTGGLLDELQRGYDALRAGAAPDIAPPLLQVADVALWQHETYGGEGLQPQLDYWRERLDGAVSSLDLPADRARPALQGFRGALHLGEVPAPLYARLEQFARERQATLSMVFLAAYQALLSRYSGQDDITVAMGVAGRARVELEPVIGFFVNTLPLRTRLDGDPSFADLLARVREQVLGAMEHAEAPLDRVLETLRLPRSASHTPFAQAMFFFQNYPAHTLAMQGLQLRQEHLNALSPGSAQGDLSLFVNQHGERELMLEYNTDLFDAARIERLCGHLLQLLDAATARPDAPLAELALLTATEREELARWNATARELPADPTVAALVQAQVQRSPDAIALRQGDRALSYRELGRRANQLAHRLRAAGVGRGQLVGLYVERTPEMLIGLLAILKAGGAYVPLDPTYPADRLAYMLEASDARVLVTQRALAQQLPAQVDHVLCADADEALDASAEHAPDGGAQAGDPAYVIFTSGSTGKPKGVEIAQRSAVNLLRSVAREPGLEAGQTLCAISTLSFDIALLELVLPLTVGATILLVDRDTARDGMRLRRLVDGEAIDVMQATPATWRMLLELDWDGKPGMKIISTGEALPRELADRLLPCGRELWNLYGPTETTVYSALCRVEAGSGPILVGKPVDNTQIHIVDRRMNLQPAGVPGELLIGGDGLAIGYRGRPDLTAEKFIPDPFGASPGGRLYRSGDLALWRRDGTIEVIGRIDHQIKLRGFRIELGEIESVLAQHPAVTQAVVHCREDRPGDKRLVAYVTVDGDATGAALLRDHLRAALPDYMVPSAYVLLERFPLTPNGKVDRRALPAPEDVAQREDGPEHALTPEQQALAAIWQQLLGPRRIAREDNFFDLGGHSLLATRLLARIQQQYGVELPLRALFEAPTLERLAERVAEECALLPDDDLESLLQSLEHLSDEEASARLAAALPGGAHG
ncbi:non-ribosomal peptide synthetase [Lysobacter silvisoli]|uniref:Amino acid adenylation domain-containing protein n=1 Tax=Lysobacter silvisoli TaxID=2293254 RepID=A0A371JYK3_9GAMM|nr:non-ribosomal peptide synthetase [Lysobacter silvisoli]RDZ26745.1 amino acid adenylation domain-containing protein [Lysobacter silvisoli]